MKIKTVDKKVLVLSEQEAYEITKNATTVPYPFTINGNAYYLAKCVRLYSDVYEATFMSKERIEIELEMEGE